MTFIGHPHVGSGVPDFLGGYYQSQLLAPLPIRESLNLTPERSFPLILNREVGTCCTQELALRRCNGPQNMSTLKINLG